MRKDILHVRGTNKQAKDIAVATQCQDTGDDHQERKRRNWPRQGGEQMRRRIGRQMYL